jgi:hypothetical protein
MILFLCIPIVGKAIDEMKIGAWQGWSRGGKELLRGYRISFGGNENILELDRSDGL